jgi:inner membrane protein
MDNITHGLFGYALARALPPAIASSPAKRRALTWCSVLASNVPDADFVFGAFGDHAKLAYLLHHRGHTHTLAVALPLGVLVGVACAQLAHVETARDRRQVWWLGAAACTLHVLLDWFNNYGVHPFFPLDNRWYYGDFVFIVEPLLLAAMIPLLALGGESRGGRAFGWLLAALWIALVFVPAPLPAALGWTLTCLFALWLAAVRALRVAGAGTIAAVALIAALFFAGSRAAEARIHAGLQRRVPGERILDLASTPFPGNPLCWSAIAVSVDRGGTYRARYAHLTLVPAWLPPHACSLAPRGAITAPLRATGLADSAALAFDRGFEGSAGELRALARDRCDARALLRFARVPYWTRAGDGRLVLGDLRYDNDPSLNFAELPLGGACPDVTPPWVPPRADLLAP